MENSESKPEIKKEETSEKTKDTIYKKIDKYLDDKRNLVLIGLLVFAFFIRLYYFFLTKNQPLWWDEAEYLLEARHLAIGTPNTGWGMVRPILFTWIATLFFKVGLGEISLRVLMLVISFFGVFLVYLVGKEIYDKNVGLIAAFIISVFYMSLFYSARMLVEVPSLTAGLLLVYVFYKGYVKNKNKHLIWFLGPISAICFMLKYTTAIFALIIIAYLLITEKLNFLKNRNLWIAVVLGFITLLPYLIWNWVVYGGPLTSLNAALFGISPADRNQELSQVVLTHIKSIPNYLHSIFLIMFIIGLSTLYKLTIGFDLINKKEHQNLRSDLFIFIWVIFTFITAAVIIDIYEDRYIMGIFPAMFFITAKGILLIYEKIKKNSKIIAISIILIIMAIGGYQLLNHSDDIIKIKLYSYIDFKLAGTWIKENSKPDDIIVGSGVPQLTYYTERAVYGMVSKEEDFEESWINEKKPKYFILSVLELSADWAYSYPERNKDRLIPVKVYSANNKDPTTVVYEIKY